MTSTPASGAAEAASKEGEVEIGGGGLVSLGWLRMQWQQWAFVMAGGVFSSPLLSLLLSLTVNQDWTNLSREICVRADMGWGFLGVHHGRGWCQKKTKVISDFGISDVFCWSFSLWQFLPIFCMKEKYLKNKCRESWGCCDGLYEKMLVHFWGWGDVLYEAISPIQLYCTSSCVEFICIVYYFKNDSIFLHTIMTLVSLFTSASNDYCDASFTNKTITFTYKKH